MKLYGWGSRLNPPFVHNGKAWGMAFKFSAEPSGHAEGVVICSGVVQSVADLGGGRVRIVIRRDYQMSDYDKSIPGEGTINIVTQHFMGGNVCNSPEWMRAISHANDMAMRGTLAGIRAMIGDGFRITRAGKKHMSEILLANAYAHVNEAVNYNGDATILPPTYIQVDINDVGCTRATDADGAEKYYEAGTLYFDDAAPEPMNCGLWIDTGSELELAERLVFDSPETSAPDENYLPPDFGAGITGARYWWNPLDLTARLASSCAAVGTSALLTWFNLNVARAEELPAASFTVVEGSEGVTGFDDAGDKLAMSAYSAGNTFDTHFTVFQPGFASWRRSTAHDAAAVWLSCDSDGFVAMRARETAGGTISDIATDEGPYTYPFQVRLVRGSGGVFTGYARNAGDDWDEIGTVTPAGVPESSTGLVGFGVESNRKSGYLLSNTASTLTRDYIPIGTGIVGAQHLQRFKTVAFGVSCTYPPGSGGVIDSVTNESTGEAMTESATARRDHYDFDGDGNLILYSESNDDRIKISYEELDDAPAGPGMAPRTFNQPNFATFADPLTDARLATTDPEENIANNSDVIEIMLEQTSWMPLVGETFEVVRGAGVVPASESVTVKFDLKNVDDHDFETVPAEHVEVFGKYMGLVLISEEYRQALEGGTVCLLLEAKRYVVQQAVDSINELKHGVEELDGLWIDAGAVGGSMLVGMSGNAQTLWGRTSMSLRTFGDSTETFWPNGYGYGETKESITALHTSLSDPASFPVWSGGVGGSQRVDLKLRTGKFSSSGTQTADPAAGLIDTYTPYVEDVVDGEYAMIYNSLWDDGSGENHFGSPVPYGGGDIIEDLMNFGFNFIPKSFSYLELISRLMEGAEILEAKIRVKFSGLEYQHWTADMTRVNKVGGGNDMTQTLYINGHMFFNRVIEGGVDVTPPYTPPDDSLKFTDRGRVSVMLGAYRRNSQYITDVNGITWAVPSDDLISGTGVANESGSEAVSGEWCIIDCTAAFKMLASMADSAAGYDGFIILPTVGNPIDVSNADSFAAYFDSIKPILETGLIDNFPTSFTDSYEREGRFARFDSMEMEKPMVRIKLGDKPAEWMALPMVPPVMRSTVV